MKKNHEPQMCEIEKKRRENKEKMDDMKQIFTYLTNNVIQGACQSFW